MPRPRSSTRGSRHQSEGAHDKPFDFVAPRVVPEVTGINFPDSDKADSPVVMESFSNSHESSGDSMGPVTPTDCDSLNQLWSTLRQQKERVMAKSTPKVQSLGGIETPAQTLTRMPSRDLKKRKSHTSFRESTDGGTVTATFDLPGIKKGDVHISFQRNRLVVDWQTVNITEREEEGKTIRERREKKYSRTIPLPEGTKFEEVRAAMDGRQLMLTYPNMRSVRTDSRTQSHGRSSK